MSQQKVIRRKSPEPKSSSIDTEKKIVRRSLVYSFNSIAISTCATKNWGVFLTFTLRERLISHKHCLGQVSKKKRESYLIDILVLECILRKRKIYVSVDLFCMFITRVCTAQISLLCFAK